MSRAHGYEYDAILQVNPSGIGLILTAVAGMFVVSLLEVAGLVSNATPLSMALNYGLFGACGGMLAYVLIRCWSKR